MAEIENNTFSRLLRISNIHSIGANDTITDFRIGLNRMTETNNIVRAVVKSVSFPNNAYNIYTTGNLKNNIFNFEIDGVATYSVGLAADGFYTTQQIIDIIKPAIQSIIDVIDPTNILTMQIGEFSKKIEYSLSKVTLSITSPGALGDGGLNSTLGNTEDLNIDNLGVAVSQEVPNLYGLTNVYIHSTTLAEGNLVDGDVENHDILGEIPVNVPFGAMVYYESQDDELDAINYLSFRNYDALRIQLKDVNDNVIQLNGGDLIIVLKLYYL
jgi:hypothetical protein